MLPARLTQLRPDEPGFVRRLASRWAGLGLLGWASRAFVALFFVLGMLVPASATRAQSASNVSVEETEDRVPTETVHIHATASRRLHLGIGATARDIEHPGAPRALNPRRTAPPRPSWLRPRRTVPPDDDDDDSLA